MQVLQSEVTDQIQRSFEIVSYQNQLASSSSSLFNLVKQFKV